MKRGIALGLFLHCAVAAAQAGGFDGCGTLIRGIECTLFAADAGGVYFVGNTAPYSVGDRIHVSGTIDPDCVTICQEGNGPR